MGKDQADRGKKMEDWFAGFLLPAGVQVSFHSSAGSQQWHKEADKGTEHVNEEVQVVWGESKSSLHTPREGQCPPEVGVGSCQPAQ